MPDTQEVLLKGSRLVVKTALVVNRVFFGGVVGLLVLSWMFGGQIVGWLLGSVVDAASAVVGLRLLMLIGLAEAVGTEIVLRALIRIVESVGGGDPFRAVNAGRLQTIGWALLGLQLLDVPGALVARFYPSLGSAAPEVSFSPGGWIAVLMVFVLSRVFAAGAVMKDDLEGTV